MSIASQTRRVDLVLPTAVPVAELVPGLARAVGVLDGADVHGGYRLLTQGGRVLAGDVGLAAQGVEDGALLTVTAGAFDEVPRLVDDVVEAMATVVERDFPRPPVGTWRGAVLVVAGLLMTLSATALLLDGGAVAGGAAVGVATVLLGGAVVHSRMRDQLPTAVTTAWMAVGHAAVGGLLLAGGDLGESRSLLGAGSGALASGLLALVGLRRRRVLMLPAVVTGAVLLAAGLTGLVAGIDRGVVLSVALAPVVLAGVVLPGLALATTRTSPEQLHSLDDVTAERAPVDVGRVEAQAGAAHEILLAMLAAVGLAVVLTAPFAVSLGLAGTLWATACCAVLMLRTRRYRSGAAWFVGLVSGVAGLASVAGATLWLHPAWRPPTAAALVLAGAVLLVLSAASGGPSVRRSRGAELAEGMVLLVLLPLLLVATGVPSALRG